MCKHVAGTLYGIGARLDAEPRLLFELRGVEESELVAGADQVGGRLKSTPGSAKVLADDDVAALFGLEMTETVDSPGAGPAAPKPKTRKSKSARDPLRNTSKIAKQTKPARQRRVRETGGRRAKKKSTRP